MRKRRRTAEPWMNDLCNFSWLIQYDTNMKLFEDCAKSLFECFTFCKKRFKKNVANKIYRAAFQFQMYRLSIIANFIIDSWHKQSSLIRDSKPCSKQTVRISAASPQTCALCWSSRYSRNFRKINGPCHNEFCRRNSGQGFLSLTMNQLEE